MPLSRWEECTQLAALVFQLGDSKNVSRTAVLLLFFVEHVLKVFPRPVVSPRGLVRNANATEAEAMGMDPSYLW